MLKVKIHNERLLTFLHVSCIFTRFLQWKHSTQIILKWQTRTFKYLKQCMNYSMSRGGGGRIHINTNIRIYQANLTNSTTGRQYENITIPYWGFNSTCDWRAAVQIDLVFNTIALIYNILMVLAPLFAKHEQTAQSRIISSYTCAASLVSLYMISLDTRIIKSDEDYLDKEKYMLYILLWFMNYLLLYHFHLLSWDQHHSIIRYRGHHR